MEFVVLLIMIIIIYLVLRFIFEVNLNIIKELAKNEELDKITDKCPENIEICKWYLKKLNNESVKIEEDRNSNSTLYLVMGNKICIGDLKDNYTRIQTIAHECLHSIQSKKMLWFNFVFSNIYLLYFLVICILGVLKVLPYKTLFLAILTLFGLIYYAIRSYLEIDAMTKARFLAKEYMQESEILNNEEIDKVVSKYDELNNFGIKFTIFNFLSKIFLKIGILSAIFIIF